jgi:ATP-dependent DNA ligase
MINAEKLKDYDPKRFDKGFASVKRNGIHGIYDPAHGFIYSRTPAKIHGLEHITAELKNLDTVLEYPVVGEIIIPGIDFETASGRIRSYNPTPEALFHIFNVITSEPFWKRWSNFHEQFSPLLCESPSIYIEPHHFMKSHKEYDTFHDELIAAGVEGTCLIHPDHVYQPGKRTWNWMKRVPYASLEAIILDVCPGTKGKKYENSLGHFVCETLTPIKKIFNVGIFKGQTDAWRQDVFDNRESYLGEMVVVEFKNLSKYGVPVQPRFKAFRWDL